MKTIPLAKWLCPNCHGQLFVIIDSGCHCWSKFPIIRVMWRRSVLFVKLPTLFKWALSFAGTMDFAFVCILLWFEKQLPTVFENKEIFRVLESVCRHGTQNYMILPTMFLSVWKWIKLHKNWEKKNINSIQNFYFIMATEDVKIHVDKTGINIGVKHHILGGMWFRN